jgi:hypothetical protein
VLLVLPVIPVLGHRQGGEQRDAGEHQSC